MLRNDDKDETVSSERRQWEFISSRPPRLGLIILALRAAL